MKTIKLLFTLVFFTFSFSASFGQSWLWAKQGQCDNGVGYGDGFGVTVDNSHNGIISGTIYNGAIFSFGSYTFGGTTYLAKYDPNGNVLWAKGSSGYGEVNNNGAYNIVATDKSNNIFMVGMFQDSIILAPVRLGTKSTSAFIVKYDSNGNALWGQNSTEPSSYSLCYAWATAADSKGNGIITGYFIDTASFGSYNLYATNDALSNVFVVKYNANGVVQWAKQSSNGGNGWGCAVVTDSYGNVYVTGYFWSSLSFGSYHLSSSVYGTPFIVKYDSNGNLKWAKQGIFKNGGVSGSAVGITIDNANRVYITGTFDSTLTFGSSSVYSKNQSVYIAKFDTNGNVKWAKQGHPLDNNSWYGYCLSADQNNHIFLSGSSEGLNNYKLFWSPDTIKIQHNSNDVVSFIAEFDTSGKALRNSMVVDCNDGNSYDGCQIASDKTGNYVYFGGDIESYSIFGKDTLRKVSNEDEYPFIARWQGIINNTTDLKSLPTPLSNVRIYPNPSNGVFTLQANSYQPLSNSSIEVYNMLGAKVYSHYQITKSSNYQIDLSNQPNGIYLYRVLDENGGLIGEGKLIIAH